MPGTLFYSVSHENWRPLLRACEAERPDGVVLLSDCDLAQPLVQELRPLFDAGHHDIDTAELHDHPCGAYQEGNLHGHCMPVVEIMVAGLGGVFKEGV